MVEVQARARASSTGSAPVIDELGARFAAAGEQIALVGGPVRDAMLGRLQHDLDFTTSARPEVTERLLKGWADAIWDMGRAFGTIGCRKGDWTGRDHDLPLGGLRPGLPQARRSPTATPSTATWAAATSPSTRWPWCSPPTARGRLEDPYGGLVDLAHRVLRTPGRPEDSFSDDPLRMMRAARFAAQLGFDGRPGGAGGDDRHGRADRDRLGRAGPRRAGQAGLRARPAARAARCWSRPGWPTHVLPELPALALERDEHHRHKDVYEHTLTVLEQAIDLEDRLPGGGPDFVSRFAALMHDVGKPRTRRFHDDGTVTFHHHDVVGAKMTRKRMKALKFANDDDRRGLARWSSCTCASTATATGEWTDSAVRRYVRDAGDRCCRGCTC